MGKSTISMVIFNSYAKLPEGKGYVGISPKKLWFCMGFSTSIPHWNNVPQSMKPSVSSVKLRKGKNVEAFSLFAAVEDQMGSQ